MGYLVYGKHAEPWRNRQTNRWEEPDKTFRALDAYGVRVTSLNDAFEFATKEDAEDWIASHQWQKGVETQIRKAK